MSDEELMRRQVELLRQQNALLRQIAKHTRLQYLLTCSLLGLLLVAAAAGGVVMLADQTGSDVNKVVAIAFVAVLGLVGLIALARREEEHAQASVGR
jgi:arginine exporter protein ArgO